MKTWMVAAVSALIGAGVATVVQMPGGVMERAGLVAPGGAIGVQGKGDTVVVIEKDGISSGDLGSGRLVPKDGPDKADAQSNGGTKGGPAKQSKKGDKGTVAEKDAIAGGDLGSGRLVPKDGPDEGIAQSTGGNGI